ncbi:MAG: hypothetical protein K5873_04140 [Treponema sp.]|nr:hypothetical protein [Treponema sp.]
MISLKKLFLYIFCGIFLSACNTDLSSEKSYCQLQLKEEKSENKDSEAIQEESEEEDCDSGETCEEEEYDYDEGKIEEEGEVTVEEFTGVIPEEPEIHREWTLMVYMAADNNLEGQGIIDLNEMEEAAFGEEVTILVLFDRSPLYDATNEDWTDTRLFKISRDVEEKTSLIASQEIECPDLGLKPGFPMEVDMASPASLSAFLSFGRKNYPADNYALILWGHGSGWRDLEEESLKMGQSSFRALAVDGTSENYMTISQLRSGIEKGMGGEKLSIIAFDTCFAMCIESAFELSQVGKYMLGTPALVPESGWNYRSVLQDFYSGERKAENLISAICNNYAGDYRNYSYASFSCIYLEKIPDLVKHFSDYSASLASAINTGAKRDKIFTHFTKNPQTYCSTTYPTDFYIDLKTLYSASSKASLSNVISISPFRQALEEALFRTWSASGREVSLGVFFCVYKSSLLIQNTHPSLYFSDSRDPLLSRFVCQCKGYVPSSDKSPSSLLDKIFYFNFYN